MTVTELRGKGVWAWFMGACHDIVCGWCADTSVILSVSFFFNENKSVNKYTICKVFTIFFFLLDRSFPPCAPLLSVLTNKKTNNETHTHTYAP